MPRDERDPRGPQPTARDLSLDEVVVVVGPSSFAPIQYNSFTVGAVTARKTLEPGDDPDLVEARLRSWARAKFAAAYKEELELYVSRVRENGELVKAAARGLKG